VRRACILATAFAIGATVLLIDTDWAWAQQPSAGFAWVQKGGVFNPGDPIPESPFFTVKQGNDLTISAEGTLSCYKNQTAKNPKFIYRAANDDGGVPKDSPEVICDAELEGPHDEQYGNVRRYTFKSVGKQGETQKLFTKGKKYQVFFRVEFEGKDIDYGIKVVTAEE
jgi:hypothetical protein